MEKTQTVEMSEDMSARAPVILFVCTGNTCRSPMAEAVFNRDYKSGGYVAESAGLFADGSPISVNSAEALREQGYGVPAHSSRQLTPELVRRADKIVGISASHMMQMILMCPDAAGKISCMPHDICDPYGGDIDIYRACLEDIRSALAEMMGTANGE